MARRRRRRRVSSSEEESESSESEDSSEESDSDESVSSVSELSGLSSSDENSDSDSEPSDGSESEFDENTFPGENRRKTEEEVRELIRDAKVMKYENAIIDEAGIDNYESMRNCDERTLKRLKMGYSDRERLLKAFRNHIQGVVEKNRERWERKKELQHEIKRKKRGKGKKGSSKGSKSKSKSKKSSSKSSKSRSKSKKSKSRSRKSSKAKIDPDEALRKIDTGWSGKKQAWADYKQHEARVAELVEFYDEIGKKRTNAEEHARKLLVSYPGGIHKLVIALDKKYHHIPYGWESLLEEALRLQEFERSESD